MALTNKQQMFVKEYLIDLNATQAAIRAGYSEKTAGQTAHEYLKKPEIAAEIQSAMDTRAEIVGINAQDVLESIKHIRSMTMADCKYSDALKANELLGKHLKLFTDKTEITGANGAPIETKWTVEIVKPKEA